MVLISAASCVPIAQDEDLKSSPKEEIQIPLKRQPRVGFEPRQRKESSPKEEIQRQPRVGFEPRQRKEIVVTKVATKVLNPQPRVPQPKPQRRSKPIGFDLVYNAPIEDGAFDFRYEIIVEF